MSREFVDALASLGERDVSAEGLTRDGARIVITFPDGLGEDVDDTDEDPAWKTLRKHRNLLLKLVRRRDEGAV